MELLLKFNRVRGNTLPTNYQYELSAWIYKVISRADIEYSDFLHETGFVFGSRKFKLFTFSQMDLRPYEISGSEIRLLGKEASLIVRFLVDVSLEHFIKGLFVDQNFRLGDRNNQVDFQVSGVETKASPHFEQTMRYQCLSPIVTSAMRDDGTAAYLSPDDPAFGQIFIQNLFRKQSALAVHHGEPEMPGKTDFPFSFRLLNTPRKKGVTIKAHTKEETKVIGYLFHFELTAPVELHEIGYYAGFGEKNSMGFGCVV
ncbi:MAG: CRISPR-associated endoribonuclease Cas6 [Cyclobacteriaceae bacterium]